MKTHFLFHSLHGTFFLDTILFHKKYCLHLILLVTFKPETIFNQKYITFVHILKVNYIM